MNLNTVTRKILVAAGALHRASLIHSSNKAQRNYAEVSIAKQVAEAAAREARIQAEQARIHAANVAAAVRQELREYGL